MRPVRLRNSVHISVLQKFIYRLANPDLDETTRSRLGIVIGVYKRLYA